MRICPSCEFQNLEGLFFCDDCGTPLFDANGIIAVPFTRKLDAATLPKEVKAVVSTPLGTTLFKAGMAVVVKFKPSGQEVRLEQRDELTFGRADPATKSEPSVDLTPFGALDNGVSRNHAAIRRVDNSLMLVDLGSVNGTFINGQQIPPNQPHVVRNGDEIQFGKLAATIFFK